MFVKSTHTTGYQVKSAMAKSMKSASEVKVRKHKLTLCFHIYGPYMWVPLELRYIDLKLLRTTGYTRVLHPKIPLGT